MGGAFDASLIVGLVRHPEVSLIAGSARRARVVWVPEARPGSGEAHRVAMTAAAQTLVANARLVQCSNDPG